MKRLGSVIVALVLASLLWLVFGGTAAWPGMLARGVLLVVGGALVWFGPDPQPSRASRAVDRWTERGIEALIHVCGFSAIVFVILIFLFIAKEGAVFLLTHLVVMFSSADWSPTHEPP